MIRYLFLFSFFIFCCSQAGLSQEVAEENDPDQLEIVMEEQNTEQDLNDVNPKRLQPHLEAGTSFTYSPNNFYGPSFYIAPSLTYLVTPRFSLTAGVAITRSNIYFMQTQGQYADNMLPMTRAFLYARGTYMLTPRLAISGTVYKSINDVPRRNDVVYPYYSNYNYQGMSMGVDYKINDAFSIGFHIGTQSGYYNPNSLIPPAGYVYVPGF